jgi:hypothetical protein
MKKIYCATAYGVGVLYIGKFYNREEENKKIALQLIVQRLFRN